MKPTHDKSAPLTILDRARTLADSAKAVLSSSRWNQATALAWALTAVGILYGVFKEPYRKANFGCYLLAGNQWIHGKPLYLEDWGGFIYSPIIAAFFSPFTLVSVPAANVIWRILSITVLLASVAYVLVKGPFRAVAARHRVFVFLALLPLSIGNLDRGQANPLVLALMLVSITAASRQSWNLAVLAIGLATYFKIYPVAVGLLLCVVSPRQVTWRLLAVLILLGLLPFALQHPHYVATEYQSWFQTRAADNRLVYSITEAPLDLWFLLVRWGNLPLNQTYYRVLEILGGGMIATFCWFAARRGWDNARLIGGLYVLASLWMILLGPSTESATYLLLAPVACIGLVQAFAFRGHPFLRILATAAFILLLIGIARNHLMAHTKSTYLLASQPLGALLFLAYSIGWLKNENMWLKDSCAN
jgi:hypothetical protein